MVEELLFISFSQCEHEGAMESHRLVLKMLEFSKQREKTHPATLATLELVQKGIQTLADLNKASMARKG